MKTLHLLRHGEPEGGKIFRGRTNDPLTQEGWQQMEAACKNLDCEVIISSPMDRCFQFAQTLSEKNNIPLVMSDDLKEFDFGIWDGQPMEKVFKEDFERLQKMWTHPLEFSAPEGESLTHLEARVLKAWFGCLGRSEKKQLIICHGGVIRIILKEVLGLPFQNINRLDVPYGCLSAVTVNDKEPYSYQLKSHG